MQASAVNWTRWHGSRAVTVASRRTWLASIRRANGREESAAHGYLEPISQGCLSLSLSLGLGLSLSLGLGLSPILILTLGLSLSLGLGLGLSLSLSPILILILILGLRLGLSLSLSLSLSLTLVMRAPSPKDTPDGNVRLRPARFVTRTDPERRT